jgi:hypothetical protein
MTDSSTHARVDPCDDELAVLRTRIEQLEDELAEQAASANAQIAEAQRRMYWLDRLDLDLNVTLGRPAAAAAVLVPLTIVRRLRRETARVRRALAR